jgi:hypothetical protein
MTEDDQTPEETSEEQKELPYNDNDRRTLLMMLATGEEFVWEELYEDLGFEKFVEMMLRVVAVEVVKTSMAAHVEIEKRIFDLEAASGVTGAALHGFFALGDPEDLPSDSDESEEVLAIRRALCRRAADIREAAGISGWGEPEPANA